MDTNKLPSVVEPDDPGLHKRYREHGFVIVEDAIPLERIAAVKEEIRSIVGHEAIRHLEVEPDEPDRFDEYLKPLFTRDPDYRHRLYETFQEMTSLYRLALNDTVLTVAKALALRAPNLRNVQTRIDIPGEDRFLQPVHQDLHGVRSEYRLNCWMPLQDVTPENGALKVFKGSHELGPVGPENRELTDQDYQSIQPAVVEEYEEIHCTIDAGDALFFGPFLVHASETNRSNRVRWTPIARLDDATRMDWLQTGKFLYEKYRAED